MVADVVNAEVIGEARAAKGLSRNDDDGVAGLSPAFIQDQVVYFFDEAGGEFGALKKARPDAKHDGHAAESFPVLAKGDYGKR